jgi:hypothetical protein
MNTTTKTMHIIQPKTMRVRVPAGLYIVSDPCYCTPDAFWDDLLMSCDYFQSKPVGIADGKQILAFGTAWGDGSYLDNFGNEYGVDAGMIGLTPYIEGWTENTGNQNIVDFPNDFDCHTDGKILTFGHIVINTDPEDDVEEDEDY